ncbi:hypothetical protein ABFP07_12875 [Acinetobacter baumannii]|nr:hypothetical protein [Acinetobacter baumannii]
MKPEQFIREFGEKKAREVVEGAPEWAIFWITQGEYHISILSFPNMTGHHSFIISDLKRLVESLDLIKVYGGIEQCRKDLKWVESSKLPETDLVKELKQAIRDHESIYGGGDD